MKFNYQFSNLLGTVYRQGNLVFAPDGHTLLSPVGNRTTLFDFKNNRAQTLSCESEVNIDVMAVTPDGNLLLAVNEEGLAMLINLHSHVVIHQYHFHAKVKAISFSPNGKQFLVTKANTVLLFNTPSPSPRLNPFELVRTFYGAGSGIDTTSIDWTSDSKAFVIGDMGSHARVYGSKPYSNLIIYSTSGHSSGIVSACFLDNNTLDFFSVSNDRICIFECDTELSGLIPMKRATKRRSEEEEGETDKERKEREEKEQREQEASIVRDTDSQQEGKVMWKRVNKLMYKESRGEGVPFSPISAVAYSRNKHLLLTGFDDGVFLLHEMPDFNLIHTLSIENQRITTVTFNGPGDWVALGASKLGQLLVWDWKHEEFIIKQQGHFNDMECLDYSPDGQHIVSGGRDYKVKLWDTVSGFGFTTFDPMHEGEVTGVKFTQNGRAVLSCSLDGTVKAYNVKTYRNFRTFASPHPDQFTTLAVDSGGDIVAAGGNKEFQIYVWSISKGNLLTTLAGHEAPISSLAFNEFHDYLASGSWDKTVIVWDFLNSSDSREIINTKSDVLSVAYRPDGEQLAVATLNGQITFWDRETQQQTGSIDGRHDLGYSRNEGDKITAKKSAEGKSFNTITYSANGSNVLAAGRSKHVCIYNVEHQKLVKRFTITCNRSMDGTQEFLDRRHMTEFGSLKAVETGDGSKDLTLPGVRKGDRSARHFKPEVRVGQIRFSPTGESWAASSTEGLLIYSLDAALLWDPFALDVDQTPQQVVRCIADKEYTEAIVIAFRLDDENAIMRAIEAVPPQDIAAIVSELPDMYIDKLLRFLASGMEKSRHVGYYSRWYTIVLLEQQNKLKSRSTRIRPAINAGIKATKQFDVVNKIAKETGWLVDYLTTLPPKRKKVDESSQVRELIEGDKEEEEDMDVLKEVEESSDDDLDTILS